MSKDVRDELKAILDDFVLFTDKTIGSNEPTELGVFLKQCGYPSAMDRLVTELTDIINSQALELLDRLEDKSERMRETQILDAPEVRAIPLSAIQEETKRYMGEL
jgi:hypothetical protein